MPRTPHACLTVLLLLGGTSAVYSRPSTPASPATSKSAKPAASVPLARFEVETLALNVARGSYLPLRAVGYLPTGERRNMTLEVTWQIDPPTRGHVDALTRFIAKESGPTRITAVLGTRRSQPLSVTVLPQGKPDWDVTLIQRYPRLPVDEKAPQPAKSANVQWVAHVKNYGTTTAPPVPVEWRVDGKTIRRGTLPKLERFAQTEVIFGHPEDGKPHTLELVVDPKGEMAETCEGNNKLAVYSDALSVGFWVEESVVRYFHQRQHELNSGSNSWEDWAQRQIAFWNKPPKTPENSNEPAANPDRPRPRWRLDRIVVVRDGMLPLAGASAETEPDRRDRTLHFARGFPTKLLQSAPAAAGGSRYHRTREATPDNPFYFDATLMSALDQAKMPEAACPAPGSAQ